MAMLLVKTVVILATVARIMSYVDMTLLIPLAQDTVMQQVHSIKNVIGMMLVLRIMGNMTASTDQMKERRERGLMTTQPSTDARMIMLVTVTLVYGVVINVCLIIIGVDKTCPGPATQD